MARHWAEARRALNGRDGVCGDPGDSLGYNGALAGGWANEERNADEEMEDPSL